MPAPKPTIYLIAGCNGAGRRFAVADKTTFAKELHPGSARDSRAGFGDSPKRTLNSRFVRVRAGGHDIPVADVRRRFKRSRIHLIDDYLPLATRWAIWDSRGSPQPARRGGKRLAISETDDVDSVRELIES